MLKPETTRKPNVVLWDLESTNLNADFGYLLCFGYKRLGDKETKVIDITQFPRFKTDPTNDKDLIIAASKILSEADAWVTHYGGGFDIPMLNSRLLYHGLKPLPPITNIDTWRIARYKMHLHSNRLASVSAFLECENKTPLSGPIWIKASAGHRPSIKYVVGHCRQDVVVLENVYKKIRCLHAQHPNLGLVGNRIDTCPKCGVFGKMQSRGSQIARTSVHPRFQCQSCGGWSTGKPVTSKNIKLR